MTPVPPARLTVLSGPSGVGKGTVVAEVRRRHPEVWVSVSVTTRRPRPGEVDGVDYSFVSDAEFDRLIAGDGLLEWAEYAGNRYGTPAAPVRERLAAGAPALLEIELQGARQVRARDTDAQLVFLAPPSWAALVDRLAGRGSEPPAVQERRLALAQAELDASGEFDLEQIEYNLSLTPAERLDQAQRATEFIEYVREAGKRMPGLPNRDAPPAK